MAQPLVSVIVPNFNGARYIAAALDSIREQTHEQLEVLVVDDCSTDGSTAVVREVAKVDPRFKVLVNSINQGVTATRQRGIAASRGQLITTLDSDDVLLSEEKLEREVELILRSGEPDCTVAYSGITHIDAEGCMLRVALSAENAAQGRVFDEMLTRSIAIPRDMMISRRLYDQVGGYDSDIPIYEDWDLKLRLAKAAKYQYSGVMGIGYRRHGTGLSSDQERCRLWMDRVFEKHVAGRPDSRMLRWRFIWNRDFQPYRRKGAALLKTALRYRIT